MRIMALDVGDKRIGVALSDPEGILASPLTIVTRGEEMADIATLTNLVNRNQAGKIIIGLPRNMDGSVGKQAQKVQDFAAKIVRFIRVPVEYRDERLTTVQAKHLSASVKKTRGVQHDAMAAALILQSYLDETREPGQS